MGEHLAEWLYCKLEKMQRKPEKILYNNAVRTDLQTLEPVGDTLGRQRMYVIKKLSLCSMIVVCGVVLSIILWIKDSVETKIVDNQIVRNAYGDGSKQVALVIHLWWNGIQMIPIWILQGGLCRICLQNRP